MLAVMLYFENGEYDMVETYKRKQQTHYDFRQPYTPENARTPTRIKQTPHIDVTVAYTSAQI